MHAWNQEFVATSREGQRYEALAEEIERALRFMRACGIDLEATHQLHQVDLYTSHEALILGYEEALTRVDSTTGEWYDCSAHMLWIGERTRQLDGAHVEFLRGVGNPLGVKLGPTATPDEVLALCEALNPARVPGRLTLISRMGADLVEDRLRPLLQAVRRAEHPVVWACDPMHAQHVHDRRPARRRATSRTSSGRSAASSAPTAPRARSPAGLHVELTGEDVTECLGGAEEILDEHLTERYETVLDPRLNGRQSIDLAFRVAELLRET